MRPLRRSAVIAQDVQAESALLDVDGAVGERLLPPGVARSCRRVLQKRYGVEREARLHASQGGKVTVTRVDAKSSPVAACSIASFSKAFNNFSATARGHGRSMPSSSALPSTPRRYSSAWPATMYSTRSRGSAMATILRSVVRPSRSRNADAHAVFFWRTVAAIHDSIITARHCFSMGMVRASRGEPAIDSHSVSGVAVTTCRNHQRRMPLFL